MILGRAQELKYLNTYYDREGSQILVVYGEKNIGKTALMKQFVQDKPCHYYHARSASEREQLYQWGKELSEDEIRTLKYPSFGELLNAGVKDGQNGKKVIIIDEFQYIVKASDTFMKELITVVHDSWRNSEVMVILCSSSIGWVENSMISKIGEAAYELSGFLKVKELEFENMIADYVKETGNHVMYRVTPMFYENELVARGVHMEAYSVEDNGEGVSFNVYAYNIQPGIVIDYATGNNWLAEDAGNNGGNDATDAPDDSTEGKYILNTSSKKVHIPTCGSVSTMSDKNKQVYNGSLEDILAQGYEKCGACKAGT